MKKGYTLVELMVALAISALLVGLAVPRFTAYQQQLEFEQEARVIQECMQSAADQAAAPVGLIVGTSKLTVTLTGTGVSVSCSYTSDAPAAISTPALAGKIALCTMTNIPASSSSQSTMTSVDPVSYDLPLVNHGGIQSITNGSGSTATPISGVTTFKFQTNCSVIGLQALITVPSSGLPIKLDIINS